MKRVLIALNYDETSQEVAKEGFALAKSLHAEVLLLHVMAHLVSYSLTYEKIEIQEMETIEELSLDAEKFLEKSKYYPETKLIKTLIKEDDLAVSILEAAKKLDINIIVMGSHIINWVEEIVSGKITNKLLQQSNIPLLIINANEIDKTNTYFSLENNYVQASFIMKQHLLLLESSINKKNKKLVRR